MSFLSSLLSFDDQRTRSHLRTRPATAAILAA